MPLILSLVCQRWRDVSLSFPRLWAYPRILERSWDNPNLADIIECYMTRSQTCPLTVELEIPTIDLLRFEDDGEDYLRPALEALVPTSTRWQRLNITGCAVWLLDHPVFYTIKGRLPILQHLEILQIYSSEVQGEIEFDIFSDCPQLRSLETRRSADLFEEDSLLEGILIPWSQIRSCRVDTLESITVLSRPCGSLEHLEIDDGNEDEAELTGIAEREERLTLNVSSLKLGGTVRETAINFSLVIDSLTFPHLSSLDISWLKRTWFTPLLECLKRSSSTLTCLNLQFDDSLYEETTITPQHIITLLRHTPKVRTLSIQLYTLCKPFLQEFALSHETFPNPDPLLPSLEKLSLWMHRYPQMDDQAVLNAVASRWLPDPDYAKSVGAACLRSVTIKFPPHVVRINSRAFFQPDMPSLQDLRAAGMRIDVVLSNH
ncbi:hypothetical protein V5O48_011661 [Marasmius crinis-equi]|uniref:F-box domain-containing protein n=1 Tax=Marasmius crinis-equi TaxID=585013 RepID=A0ABR3F3H0_9AGAR